MKLVGEGKMARSDPAFKQDKWAAEVEVNMAANNARRPDRGSGARKRPAAGGLVLRRPAAA
jgi:hypothetical protein